MFPIIRTYSDVIQLFSVKLFITVLIDLLKIQTLLLRKVEKVLIGLELLDIAKICLLNIFSPIGIYLVHLRYNSVPISNPSI